MENIDNVHNDCVGRACQWVAGKDGKLTCVTGSRACTQAKVLEAEESDFHDARLIKATQAIREILAEIGADANGRELSFVHTNMGSLLAWVNHGGAIIEDGITVNDDDATVSAALKLKKTSFTEEINSY